MSLDFAQFEKDLNSILRGDFQGTEKLNTALNAFAVPKGYIFEIFYNIRDSETLSFKQTFSVCGNCPGDPILIQED